MRNLARSFRNDGARAVRHGANTCLECGRAVEEAERLRNEAHRVRGEGGAIFGEAERARNDGGRAFGEAEPTRNEGDRAFGIADFGFAAASDRGSEGIRLVLADFGFGVFRGFELGSFALGACSGAQSELAGFWRTRSEDRAHDVDASR